MLTSFITHDSWVNQVSQTASDLFGDVGLKHYDFVELSSHRNLLLIDFVEYEHDEKGGESFEHHRKLLTSNVLQALRLINGFSVADMKLYSLSLLNLEVDQPSSMELSNVSCIEVMKSESGNPKFKLQLKNGLEIFESLFSGRHHELKKSKCLFTNNKITTEGVEFLFE